MKKPKFSIGDHVIVIEDNYSSGEQLGLVGTVYSVRHGWVYVDYDIKSAARYGAKYNSYKAEEIIHTELHKSPLMKALS